MEIRFIVKEIGVNFVLINCFEERFITYPEAEQFIKRQPAGVYQIEKVFVNR